MVPNIFVESYGFELSYTVYRPFISWKTFNKRITIQWLTVNTDLRTNQRLANFLWLNQLLHDRDCLPHKVWCALELFVPGLMTYVHVQAVSPNHRGRISESPVAFLFSPVVEKKKHYGRWLERVFDTGREVVIRSSLIARKQRVNVSKLFRKGKVTQLQPTS